MRHHVQAKPSGASTISRVGCSFEGQAWQSPMTPHRSDQGGGEGDESVGCSDRVQQTKGYTVTGYYCAEDYSPDDVQQPPRGPIKVHTYCTADAVW